MKLTCPVCEATATPDALYCEACGTQLADAPPAPEAAPGGVPSPPGGGQSPEPAPGGVRTPAPEPAAGGGQGSCPACGGEFADDGYCQNCGAKARSPRDHFTEQPAPWVAATCDRGIRHRRNEDAVALAADPTPGSRAVLVVCDGVTAAEDSDIASLAAARAARDVLAASRSQGLGTDSSRVAAVHSRLKSAADAANDAVIANTPDGSTNPPSCTFVTAVVEPGLVVAGSVGDSRAYWLPDSGEPRALTVDDSYAAEQIANGVPRKEAETGPHAHAITRWLGIDAPDHTPRLAEFSPESAGWLLVCSDGLWNYCSPPDEMAALVSRVAGEHSGDPLATSTALVDWANDQGGQDNITVALARIPLD
jgi:serine/threonine protein phosphatase PrpC